MMRRSVEQKSHVLGSALVWNLWVYTLFLFHFRCSELPLVYYLFCNLLYILLLPLSCNLQES